MVQLCGPQKRKFFLLLLLGPTFFVLFALQSLFITMLSIQDTATVPMADVLLKENNPSPGEGRASKW